MDQQEDMAEGGVQDLSIPADIAHFYRHGILDFLLADQTTGGNIIWATSAYESFGEGFSAEDAITAPGIIGQYAMLLRRRAQKDRSEQAALTRDHAEVFTPMWVCKLMIDQADAAWVESSGIESLDDDWRTYVKSNRLEITCGEAPYLVSRYDAADGHEIPLADRVGILDRKLRMVSAHVKRRQDWILWATKAVQSTYGYEFQGDNLLIARINVLRSIEDYLNAAGYSPLTPREYNTFADVVSWNLWQMDGLTGTVPFGHIGNDYIQDDLFGDLDDDHVEQEVSSAASIVQDWKAKRTVEYRKIRREGNIMKFDYIIGNPPYQEEIIGTSDGSLYDKFMEGSYGVADVVELITPARFLFVRGKAKKWARERLNDPHFKVIKYWKDDREVFPGTEIKGGVAITYRDARKNFGAIGTFSGNPVLDGILRKVSKATSETSLDDMIYVQTKWNLSALFADHPECRMQLGSGGKERRMTSSIFTTVDIFDEEENDHDVQIVGRVDNSHRGIRYIDSKYIDEKDSNLNYYKVIIAKANGSGKFGEKLSSPIIGKPMCGYTQSFISFGAFPHVEEAESLMKYIKTKFTRALLSTIKATQDNNKGTWVNVPMQNFTSSSDIDWSKSISEIDQQLYKKYGLSQDEIDFIESHAEEMD